MDQVVFVPLSDDILFDHPELINGPLVPYTPGMNVDPARVTDAPCSPATGPDETTEAVGDHVDTGGRRARR